MSTNMDLDKELTYNDKKKLILLHNRLSLIIMRYYKIYDIDCKVSSRLFNLYGDKLNSLQPKTQVEFLAIREYGNPYILKPDDKHHYDDITHILESIGYKSFEFLDINYRTININEILNNLPITISIYNDVYMELQKELETKNI